MLRPSKKMTRREIQEDALVTLYVKTQKFFRLHSQKIMIGAGAVAVVALIVVFMARSKKSADIQAAGKLGVAEQFYYAQQYQRALPEFQQIIDTYPGTKSAGIAIFLTANAHYATGNILQAERVFRDYVKGYKHDRMFTASATAGIAACMDAQQKYGEAASYFEKAARVAPKSFSASYYLYDAARCFALAGNTAKAAELYTKIQNDNDNPSLAQEASFHLEALSLN